MENSVSLHSQLCGGTKLIVTKDIFVNQPRFGNSVIMNPVDLP